jgi:hypothetical protein
VAGCWLFMKEGTSSQAPEATAYQMSAIPKVHECMPTKQELEKLSTIRLAVMCGRVADDPEQYSQAGSEKALELRTEWASLQTPRELSLKDQEKKEQQLATLHTRMVDFLAGIL